MKESSVDVNVLPAPSLSVSNGVSEIRPEVRGKFFFVDDQKLDLKGLTYGPFAPGPDGSEYHDEAQVAEDFRRMRAIGANLIRTYTVPPDWMLDLARDHGLYLLVGLPWTQHVAFLENSDQREAIARQVREGVRTCAGHSAVLAYAVGNELPPSIVRWYGPRRVARFLRQLDHIVREEDEDALVTYVNFPTTQYLQLPFLDFVSFNVYLEDLDRLDEYLAHLHHRAGDRGAAQELNDDLVPLNRAVTATHAVPGVKYVMRQRGAPAGRPAGSTPTRPAIWVARP
jgi:beta-galactosidase/beta-glucuronidase